MLESAQTFYLVTRRWKNIFSSASQMHTRPVLLFYITSLAHDPWLVEKKLTIADNEGSVLLSFILSAWCACMYVCVGGNKIEWETRPSVTRGVSVITHSYFCLLTCVSFPLTDQDQNVFLTWFHPISPCDYILFNLRLAAWWKRRWEP